MKTWMSTISSNTALPTTTRDYCFGLVIRKKRWCVEIKWNKKFPRKTKKKIKRDILEFLTK